MLYPTPIAKLIDSFSKLPVSASRQPRLAFLYHRNEWRWCQWVCKNLRCQRELTYCSICGIDGRWSLCYLYGSNARSDCDFDGFENSRDVSAMENIQNITAFIMSFTASFPYERCRTRWYQPQESLDSLDGQPSNEVIVATNATARRRSNFYVYFSCSSPLGIRWLVWPAGLASSRWYRIRRRSDPASSHWKSDRIVRQKEDFLLKKQLWKSFFYSKMQGNMIYWNSLKKEDGAAKWTYS